MFSKSKTPEFLCRPSPGRTGSAPDRVGSQGKTKPECLTSSLRPKTEERNLMLKLLNFDLSPNQVSLSFNSKPENRINFLVLSGL